MHCDFAFFIGGTRENTKEMEFLRHHKDVASVEATPHRLTLEAPQCYERLGTLAQMNPPVRDASHRAGIWRGIEQGIVDVLGSGRAPHTREEKTKDYPATRLAGQDLPARASRDVGRRALGAGARRAGAVSGDVGGCIRCRHAAPGMFRANSMQFSALSTGADA